MQIYMYIHIYIFMYTICVYDTNIVHTRMHIHHIKLPIHLGRNSDATTTTLTAVARGGDERNE